MNWVVMGNAKCFYGLLCIEMGMKWRVLSRFGVIMFFRKDPPQTEGRRDAHHEIKTPPVRGDWTGARLQIQIHFGFGTQVTY